MAELDSLLAQSIFPRLNCSQYRSDAEYRDRIDKLIESKSVGGFVAFDGDVATVQSVLADLQKLAGGTLLFAADCEDGITMRFSGGTEFPSMMALGRSGDVSATYSVARSIAREMRSLGIYWNFAPVADVNTNPENPIINIRAFGEQPESVADHVHAYIQGMQDGGVAACVKHFPGHGDTHIDSHIDLPILEFDRRRLDSVELLPFRQAIRNGVKSVMVAHIAVPSLDPSEMPASLSAPIVTGLLREDLGYEGIVVTDALDMNAITHRGRSDEVAVLAYQAGVDVLILPEDPEEALRGLRSAVAGKQIKPSRVKASVGRIVALKKWTSSYQDDVQSTLTWRGHDVIALEAARRSIQVIGRIRKLYPPLLVVAVADTLESAKAEEWFGYFSAWYEGEASGVVVTPTLEEGDREEIMNRIAGAGSIILAIFVRPHGFAGTIGLSDDQRAIVDLALTKPSVVASFGNPYLLSDADSNVRIDTYSSSSASLAASIEALSRATK